MAAFETVDEVLEYLTDGKDCVELTPDVKVLRDALVAGPPLIAMCGRSGTITPFQEPHHHGRRPADGTCDGRWAGTKPTAGALRHHHQRQAL